MLCVLVKIRRFWKISFQWGLRIHLSLTVLWSIRETCLDMSCCVAAFSLITESESSEGAFQVGVFIQFSVCVTRNIPIEFGCLRLSYAGCQLHQTCFCFLEDIFVSQTSWKGCYMMLEWTFSDFEIDPRPLRGETPLHLAASNGHVAVVQQLLAAKAAMEVATERGWGLGDVESFERIHLRRHESLQENLASWHLDIQNHEHKLSWEVNDKHQKHSEPKKQTKTKNGCPILHRDETPLRLAAYNGHVAVVQRLLAAKAAVDAGDFQGPGPRGWATVEATELSKRRVGTHLLSSFWILTHFELKHLACVPDTQYRCIPLDATYI